MEKYLVRTLSASVIALNSPSIDSSTKALRSSWSWAVDGTGALVARVDANNSKVYDVKLLLHTVFVVSELYAVLSRYADVIEQSWLGVADRLDDVARIAQNILELSSTFSLTLCVIARHYFQFVHGLAMLLRVFLAEFLDSKRFLCRGPLVLTQDFDEAPHNLLNT